MSWGSYAFIFNNILQIIFMTHILLIHLFRTTVFSKALLSFKSIYASLTYKLLFGFTTSLSDKKSFDPSDLTLITLLTIVSNDKNALIDS